MSSNIKTTLAYRISDILRQEIVVNKIKKGDHFNETLLAKRFGVSRGPIRDALKALETEGFATSLPNGRSIANGFTKEDIAGYYNLRFFLESESIKYILGKAADQEYWEWISDLEAILSESHIQLENDNEWAFTELDSKFHYTIVSKANFKLYMHIWEITNNLSRTIMEMNRSYIMREQVNDYKYTFSFHGNILIGLKNRDLMFTLTNLEKHVEKGIETISYIIENFAEAEDKHEVLPSTEAAT